MENPEKPQTITSEELAQTIWHVAGIAVLLNMTNEENADCFVLSVNTLADWKRQPEWKEARAAFAKAELAPSDKKFLKKGPFARQIMLNHVRVSSPSERLRNAKMFSRVLTVWWVRRGPASRWFIERGPS
jgi:uncharacterized protein YjcR